MDRMSSQISILRVNRSGEGLESIVIGMVKRAEQPEIVCDLMTQRFGEGGIVQHQRQVRSQHLQRLEVSGTVGFLALPGTEHESANRAGTHTQRRKAFD